MKSINQVSENVLDFDLGDNCTDICIYKSPPSCTLKIVYSTYEC